MPHFTSAFQNSSQKNCFETVELSSSRLALLSSSPSIQCLICSKYCMPVSLQGGTLVSGSYYYEANWESGEEGGSSVSSISSPTNLVSTCYSNNKSKKVHTSNDIHHPRINTRANKEKRSFTYGGERPDCCKSPCTGTRFSPSALWFSFSFFCVYRAMHFRD